MFLTPKHLHTCYNIFRSYFTTGQPFVPTSLSLLLDTHINLLQKHIFHCLRKIISHKISFRIAKSQNDIFIETPDM